MKARTPRRDPTHYLIAAAILLAGCVISALILFQPFQMKTDTVDPGPTDQRTDASSDADKTVSHSVSFYGYDGQLLTTRTVADGAPAQPPEMSASGSIFKGWSEELYSITADLDVYPIGEAVGDRKNVVYADAVYTGAKDRICVTPKISGAVDCCDFTIDIAYDSALLTFDGAEPALEGLRVENHRERGVLTLTYSASSSLTQPTELADLYFMCAQDGAYHTNLPMTTNEILTMENGATVYTDSTAYDTALYLFD